VVAHGHLDDAPSRPGGAQHHLQRPAEATVEDAQLEKGLPAGDPHGAEVGQGHAGAPAHLHGHQPVAQPGVERPGPPACPAGTEHQVGLLLEDGGGDGGELGGVERAVAVHEADDVVGGGGQAGEAGGAEAPSGLADHLGPQTAGHLP
jgi:hypothetical protein